MLYISIFNLYIFYRIICVRSKKIFRDIIKNKFFICYYNIVTEFQKHVMNFKYIYIFKSVITQI